MGLNFKLVHPAILARQNLSFVIRTYRKRATDRILIRDPRQDSAHTLRSDLWEVLHPFLQEMCPVWPWSINDGLKVSIDETGVHVLFEGELRKVLLNYRVIEEGDGV
jgi:hypothetical protein